MLDLDFQISSDLFWVTYISLRKQMDFTYFAKVYTAL